MLTYGEKVLKNGVAEKAAWCKYRGYHVGLYHLVIG